MDISELERVKARVDQMNKVQHMELLHILRQFPLIKLNENKSGVFVNLPFLPQEALDAIVQFVEYVVAQEDALSFTEVEKDSLKKNLFQ
jgi:hypothetical protein